MTGPNPPEPARNPQEALGEPCVLVKLGEIVLKGRNRQQFERLLHTNIRGAVRGLGFPVRLWQREGVILLRIEADPAGLPQKAAALADRVRDIPGIVRVCPVLRVAKDADAAAAAAIELIRDKPGALDRKS